MGGAEESSLSSESRRGASVSVKTTNTNTRRRINHVSFNNYSDWKHKLRENCCKRIRHDRTRLLWKMRLLPQHHHNTTSPHSSSSSSPSFINQATLIKSTLQGIVSDEFRKITTTHQQLDDDDDDLLWDYNGLNAASQGDCEDILLQLQTIFYQDLMLHPTIPESCMKTWEDEEDEYLARAVYEHMQLSDDRVQKTVWCPICKQGELQENYTYVYCTTCELRLLRGEEVTMELIRNRLAEAHAEHLDRGCKLTPKIRMESRFNLTVLYIKCQGCDTFEVVI